MNFTTNQPTTIVVASQNPVKSGAIGGAFQKLFPELTISLVEVSVDSGVGDQPMSDIETKRGATNRIAAARELHPDAQFWTSIEGGIERHKLGMTAFAWIVVETERHTSAIRSATFPLPPRVVALLDEGVELGHANDQVFGRENSKHKEGAVGTLTAGLIDRRELYEHAAIMAFVPWKNPDLFP